MNARRKLFLAILTATIAFAATALPSSAAPEKIFRIDVTPEQIAAGGTATFSVKYTNVTPGNSSFNSIRLTVPSALTISGAVAVTGSNANASKVVAVDGQVVTVSMLDPVKNTQNVTIAVQVTAGGGGGCAGSTVNWPDSAFEAWTGSQQSGNTFRLAQKFGTTTTVNASCSLRFVSGQNPGNSSVGQTIPGATGGNVQVELISGSTPSNSLDGQTVTLSKVSGPTAALSGATAQLSSGVATFNSFSIDTAGTYTVKASVGGVGGFETATSPSFEIFGGEINCGDEIDFTGDQLDGTRGAFNKDGSTCVRVNYTVRDEVASRNEFSVSWDTGVQPTATFEYTVAWNAESVNASTGLPSERTQLAWSFSGTDPIWQFGVACTSTALPTPFGTLVSEIDANVMSLQVDTSSGTPLPPAPFAFVIGTERFWATAVSGSGAVKTLTLGDGPDSGSAVRGEGGTTAASHSATAPVMSTPLPIDPNATRPGGGSNPFQGKQIPMCIAQEGWVAAGTSAAGTNRIQVTSRIFDIGDGAGKRI